MEIEISPDQERYIQKAGLMHIFEKVESSQKFAQVKIYTLLLDLLSCKTSRIYNRAHRYLNNLRCDFSRIKFYRRLTFRELYLQENQAQGYRSCRKA